MKLGPHVGYWGLGLGAAEQFELVRDAGRLGYESLIISPMAWSFAERREQLRQVAELAA